MTHVSLFSGIGGLDLAAEWAGFRTILQVESAEYPRRVLEEHWPGVPRINDIREVTSESVNESVTVVSGGFPCQDISQANQFNRAGIDGERSGLWSEMCRVLCVLRPRWAVVENVPALLLRGLGRVLGDLACIGYDAEWDCLSAWQFGAPHARKRLFVVAYPAGERLETLAIFGRADFNSSAAPVKEWQEGKHDEQYLFDQIFGYRLPSPPSDLRLDDGIPPWMDEIQAWGNAVVPQQAYPIFAAIAAAEQRVTTIGREGL